MKPVRFLTTAVILLMTTSMVFAITPAGTTITNQATGTYADANGNAMTGVSSNSVTTTVSAVGGVTLTTGFNQSVDAFNSVAYAITLTNTGNDDDKYALDYSAVLGGTSTFADSLFLDNGTTPGVRDAGDTYIADGDSLTVTFAAGSADLLLTVTDNNATGAIDADDVTVTLTATSSNTGTPSDSQDYVTTAAAAELTIAQTVTPPPTSAGDPVTYTVCLTNDGSLVAYNGVYTLPLSENFDFTAVTSIAVNVTYTGETALNLVAEYPGPTDTNADSAYVSGGELIVLLRDIPAADGVCIEYTLTLKDDLVAPITVPSEPVVTYEEVGGESYPTPDPDSAGGEVTIAADYSVSIVENTNTPTPFTTPIDTVFYGFSLDNTGNGTDNFVLSGDNASLTYEFYVDADSNGVLSATELAAGALTSDTYTGLAWDDTPVWIIATIIIPGDASDEDTYAVTITATSVGGTEVTDTLAINITVALPNLQLLKSVDNSTAAPGDTLTYTVQVINHGSGVATDISVEDLIPTNTTYVDSSITYALNAGTAAARTDDTGDDEGEYDGSTKVTFTVTSLAADPDGAGPNVSSATFTFKVTID